jgi:hypothetical protein
VGRHFPQVQVVNGKTLESVAQLLGPSGLIVRGGFNFSEQEAAPEFPGRGPAKSIMLIGHGGGDFWPIFRAWLDRQQVTPPNPLDSWSRVEIDNVARGCDAHAVYPSDIPYLPFQQWAIGAEGLQPSPLGILIHPEFGLWHAYRGALLFDCALEFETVENAIHLCDLCDGKPCLNSCPIGAFTIEGYAVANCRAHVASAEGGICKSGGCIARNACPHGVQHRYLPEQQVFHMAAFLRGRT